MTRRGGPVLEFPAPMNQQFRPLKETWDWLRAALGRLVPIVDITLLSNHTGLAVVGAVAPGTALPEARCAIDAEDAWCDQARLVVHAQNSAAGPRTLQVFDVTNAVALCSASITNALATVQGAWTPVVPKGGDRVLELRAIGNGAETQTIYSAHLQLRTVRFQP